MNKYIVLYNDPSLVIQQQKVLQLRNGSGRQKWYEFLSAHPSFLSRVNNVVVILNHPTAYLPFWFYIPDGIYDIYVQCVAPSTSSNNGVVQLDGSEKRVWNVSLEPNQYSYLHPLYSSIFLKQEIHIVRLGYREPVGILSIIVKKQQSPLPPLMMPALEVLNNKKKIFEAYIHQTTYATSYLPETTTTYIPEPSMPPSTTTTTYIPEPSMPIITTTTYIPEVSHNKNMSYFQVKKKKPKSTWKNWWKKWWWVVALTILLIGSIIVYRMKKARKHHRRQHGQHKPFSKQELLDIYKQELRNEVYGSRENDLVRLLTLGQSEFEKERKKPLQQRFGRDALYSALQKIRNDQQNRKLIHHLKQSPTQSEKTKQKLLQILRKDQQVHNEVFRPEQQFERLLERLKLTLPLQAETDQKLLQYLNRHVHRGMKTRDILNTIYTIDS